MNNTLREQVWEILHDVYDPEIPLNIADLGLIYDLQVSDQGEVHILMTLTAPGCPVGDMIADEIRDRVMSLPGVQDVQVEFTFDPLWTPERISEEGREALRAFGFPV
ncbi:MAG: iron-sulfur cluster assembly protein [Armatimonadetes bacterium]|nr:iron-sulfur cluster assembly protein [Armatimonadota bacterium]CUU38435.1 FeS assembly SUF system protein [Armatimonadetes bacterium DC]